MNIGRWKIWSVILVGVACGVIVGQGAQQAPARQNTVVDPDSLEGIVGRTQPVPHDDNVMVASVAKAAREGKNHERFSAMILPAAFDQGNYKKGKNGYINTVEPGRIWQSAQPGEGVWQITNISPSYVEAAQGEPVVLKVVAAPDAPVTFTSFDGGAFSNKLPSITVAADQKGVAVASFVGTPGTYNEVNILAASPLTAGQAKFVVNVVIPRLREHEKRIKDKGSGQEKK